MSHCRTASAYHLLPLSVALLLAVPAVSALAADTATQLEEVRVLGTAEEELKQALGVSTITAEDLRKAPPVNDIAEIVRRQPGVNLTGNSTSGMRGNNRQIDIRGMGPENTMILIDGKPVASRNSVRFGWRGERDSRGDSNWVPPEQIERIEVLRGPAAARYGSGSAGGVVNIITTKAGKTHGGNISLYANLPQHSDEGATRRLNFGLHGPLADKLSYRIYGNLNKTDADDFDINRAHASERGGVHAGTFPAGREGVRNRDLNAALTWAIADGHEVDFEAGFSRQGNIYAGDSQNTNTNVFVQSSIGKETNRLYRQNYAITHRGQWDADTSSLSYLQYERTRNVRLQEGLAGGTEGIFNDPNNPTIGGFGNIELSTLTAHGEVSRRFPIAGLNQVLTIGAEFQRQSLKDGDSDLKGRNPQAQVPLPPYPYRGNMSARTSSIFVESNLHAGDNTTLTPGLRLDHHSEFGNNWTPSLNAAHYINDFWTVKAGVARAYKAPNLYQSNPGYALYSNGIGCAGGAGNGCFLTGNADLKAETSINKELGIAFANGETAASITYFHNDYRNKVEAGTVPASLFGGRRVFQWENVPKAVVSGLEGNLTLPLSHAVSWNTNFTYMLQSKNKQSGEQLSVIPKYTVNTTLDWAVNDKLSLQAKATFYGEQKPQKFDYQGNPVTGSAASKRSAYNLVGLSGSYRFDQGIRLTLGIDNLFDKRLFREGNASGVTGGGGAFISGAGANTYNEPGRTFFAGLSATF